VLSCPLQATWLVGGFYAIHETRGAIQETRETKVFHLFAKKNVNKIAYSAKYMYLCRKK
jgi:hypothetical protein